MCTAHSHPEHDPEEYTLYIQPNPIISEGTCALIGNKSAQKKKSTCKTRPGDRNLGKRREKGLVYSGPHNATHLSRVHITDCAGDPGSLGVWQRALA